MSKKKALPPKVREAMERYIDAYIAFKESTTLMSGSMLDIAHEYPIEDFEGEVIEYRDKKWKIQDLFKGPSRWQSVFVEQYGIREVK
jgi:hypothetical protein